MLNKPSVNGGTISFPPVDKFPSRDLNQLYPNIKKLALKLIVECKKAKIDIIITQTYRSALYQQELYNKGRSTKGGIVTNCKPGQSPHEFRVAFDVCINSKTNPYNVALLKKVGAIGIKLGLIWGGNFKSLVDMPHFQYNGGLTDREIRLGRIPK